MGNSSYLAKETHTRQKVKPVLVLCIVGNWDLCTIMLLLSGLKLDMGNDI